MIQFDEKKLDGLLAEKRFEEARAYVQSAFPAGQKPEDKADAAIDYAIIYLKMMNRINRSYLQSLKSIAGLLEDSNRTERQIRDTFAAAKLRSDLALGGAK